MLFRSDATIPENVPRERYQRIVYFNQGKVKLKDYLGAAAGRAEKKKEVAGERGVEVLAETILRALSSSHKFFAEILELFPGEEFGRIARAIGWLQQNKKIRQDGEGRYQLAPEGLSQTR